MKKKATILGIIGALAFVVIKEVLNMLFEPDTSSIVYYILLVFSIFLLYCYITKDKK